MKRWLLPALLIAVIGSVALAYVVLLRPPEPGVISPIGTPVREKPLERYAIETLAKRVFTPVPVEFGDVVATTAAYTAQLFSFRTEGDKTVTGMAHIPKGKGPFPVVVQFRGYVDPGIYSSGVGTKHSAEVYAANGFLSLAPDFLGYGGSDKTSSVPLAERFETYTTALTILASIGSIPIADPGRVALWGHSNGGQIALTVLAVTGKPYPTALWAPVTKPFPYNILAYTDEFADLGKSLRRVVADFEKEYDPDRYSFTSYLTRITAPIEIHQGEADEEVPVWWSREFTDTMRNAGHDIRLYTYPGMDHNMSGGGWWNGIVERTIRFYNARLK